MTSSYTLRCKLCGSPSTFLCSTPNEHGAVQSLDHYRCTHCGLVFVGTPLTTDELAEAYGTLNADDYFREIQEENRKKFATAATALDRITSKGARIIDLGAGSGEFSEFLADRGFRHVAAHEIPGTSLGRLRSRGIEVFEDFDYASIPDSSFDCITLLDVAEHVLDPNKLFSACNRILKTNGYLYFHTPVVTKVDQALHLAQRVPMANKIGRIWQRGRTSIFHLQNYTTRAINIALQGMGFDVLDIACRNELSWPVERYVRVYICEKQRIPTRFAPLLSVVFRPLLATEFFNANKAIVTARKSSNAARN